MSVFSPFFFLFLLVVYAVELLVPPFSQVLQLEQQLAVETSMVSATKTCKYGSTLSC